MQHIRNILLATYIGAIAIGLAMVALWETNTLPVAVWEPHSNGEFAWATIMELVTIAAIPLALRLMRMGFVRRSLRQYGQPALLKWSMARLAILCLPMLANTLLYYMYMSTTFGYMSIILLLCLAFVFPTTGRCHYELHSATKE